MHKKATPEAKGDGDADTWNVVLPFWWGRKEDGRERGLLGNSEGERMDSIQKHHQRSKRSKRPDRKLAT